MNKQEAQEAKARCEAATKGMSDTFEITWEADDGYVSGSAPQHLKVFESEIEESYSEQDLKDLFWSLVQEDFSEKVHAVSEDEAAFLIWAKGVIEKMKSEDQE